MSIVKRTFQMENLDCANCAAKMENGIGRIEGVVSATVSFMTQRLVIEAEETAFDAILKQAGKIVKKVDADCSIRV